MKSKTKSAKNPFHWRHYEGESILLTVRCYCSYGLSYRNLVEMMEERGLYLAHTTIMRSKTIAGIEAMHTLWKGQMRRCFSAGLYGQKSLINCSDSQRKINESVQNYAY